MQKGKPIAFASKGLTPSEVQYAQIEKEMLSIFFGWKRFHQDPYGREIKVETDYKPLVPIIKMAPSTAPRRLQRMLLQLQSYDLLKSHMYQGNRFSLPTQSHVIFFSDSYPIQILANLPISDRKLLEVRREMETDKQFQLLLRS